MQQQRPHGPKPQPRAGRMLAVGLLGTVGVFAVAGLLWNAFAAQQLFGNGEPVYPQLLVDEPVFYAEMRLPDAEQIDEDVYHTDLLEEDEHERFRRFIEEQPHEERLEALDEEGRRVVRTAVRLHNEELLPEQILLTTVGDEANPEHLEDLQLVAILVYDEQQDRNQAAQIIEERETLTVNYGDDALLMIGREEQTLRQVAQLLGEQERELPERYQEAFELHSDEIGIFAVCDTQTLWRHFVDELAKEEPRYLEEVSHETRQRIHEVLSELFPPEGLGNFAYFKGIEHSEYRLPVESEELDRSHLMGEGGSELANYIPVNAGYLNKLSLFKGPIEEDAEEPLIRHLRRLVPLIDELGRHLGDGENGEALDEQTLRQHLRATLRVCEGNFAFAVFPTFAPLPENQLGITFLSHVTDGNEAYQRTVQAMEELGIDDNVNTVEVGERRGFVIEMERSNVVALYDDEVAVYLAVAGEKLDEQVVGQYLDNIEENSIAGQDVLGNMIQEHNVSFDHTMLSGINLANIMEIKHPLAIHGIKMRLRLHGQLPEHLAERDDIGGGAGAIEPERHRIVREDVDYENPLAQRWIADSVHFEDGLNGHANYGLREGFALMYLGDYLRHRHRTQAYEVLEQERLREAMQQFVAHKRELDDTEPTRYWEDQLILMLDEPSQEALLTLRPTRIERERFERDDEIAIPAKAEEFEAHMKEEREFTILIIDPRTNEPVEITVPIDEE